MTTAASLTLEEFLKLPDTKPASEFIVGWLIDPDERLILAFITGQEPVELTGSELLPISKFLTLDLTVEQVFGWLKVAQ